MDPADGLRIEVVWSPQPLEVHRVALTVPPGCTAAQALAHSRLMDGRPERSDVLQLGVWGRAAEPETVLRDGDRVEVYRALTVDPKEARRLRYQRKPVVRKPPTGR